MTFLTLDNGSTWALIYEPVDLYFDDGTIEKVTWYFYCAQYDNGGYRIAWFDNQIEGYDLPNRTGWYAIEVDKEEPFLDHGPFATLEEAAAFLLSLSSRKS